MIALEDDVTHTVFGGLVYLSLYFSAARRRNLLRDKAKDNASHYTKKQDFEIQYSRSNVRSLRCSM